MKPRKIQIMLPVLAGLTLLSGCGQNDETAPVSEAASVELPNGMTVKEQRAPPIWRRFRLLLRLFPKNRLTWLTGSRKEPGLMQA